MIEGKYLYGLKSDLSEVFAIRREVFVKEDKLLECNEFDGLDTMCVHALISVEGKNLGTGRILYNGDEYRIGHICILKEERGKKYGDFIVRMLIDKAFLSGADEIMVGSKISAVSFYETIGFVKIGEEYRDASGVLRIDMKVNKGTLCRECQK
ncbi:MAG: GNAT family N-acetyltransferase [Velocimicrobium sp.]